MRLAASFFETARERYQIKIKRGLGLPREQWTKDPHFKEWRFCNVFREDDATTIWFRENIRNTLSAMYLSSDHEWQNFQHIVFSTIAFRWFNRIEVGELIKSCLLQGPEFWKFSEMDDFLRSQLEGPVVTGAYIIKGWDGYDKLTGVLKCIQETKKLLPKTIREWDWQLTLEKAHEDLQVIPYMGPFMSYEVISDLRWTPVLSAAGDINTWANPGPGCRRGLGWVVYGDSDVKPSNSLQVMRELHSMSQDVTFWPMEWPRWEMREVEHWLCEFDKYNRAAKGDRLKRRYR